MRWIKDDSYLEKTKGKARKIIKGGDRPLPWWWNIDPLRLIIKISCWNFAVMFGVSEERSKIGYRFGFIANGHAYLSDKVLHHRDAIIHIREQDWTFFAVDLDGNVIPDEGEKKDLIGKEFWVDENPDPAMSSFLEHRPIVD